MKKSNQMFLVLCAFTLMACSSSHKKKHHVEEQKVARADLMTSSHKSTGSVDFQQTGDGIKVMVMMTGLKPKSTHGLHIHEKGQCTGPDFKSAGEHFNPDHTPHGGPNSMKKHPGDFGNITADAQGVATKEVMIPTSELKNLEEIEGKAVILHSKADDLTSQPSGNSGARLACGVII